MTATDTFPAAAPLGRVSARLASLTGWRRLIAAAAFGGLATFALPPAGAVPVLLVAFPALLWLLDGVKTRRAAFGVGWFFGFGHHLLGLYWVSAALFTDIERFWWALPLSAAGLPIVMAMFSGGAVLLFHMLRARGLGAGLARPVLFAACWGLFEWLRGHVFTGFPWNLIGYSWDGVLPVLQGASLFGVYGLGLLTVLVAGLPAVLADPPVPARRAWAAPWVAVTAGFALFAGLGIWGAVRLAGAGNEMVPGVRLRLVQAGIDQRLKWAPGERERNVQKHLALSAAPGPEPVTHVIWAETAVPMFIEQDARVRQALGSVVPPGGLLITGAPRTAVDGAGERHYYNSLMALDGSGAVTGVFDKFHLVPFGEYMPLRRWLPVGAIAGNGAEFSPGPGLTTLPLAGLPPVSPLICYEGIFPAAVVDQANRPQWMLNLTNDAWYGQTAGPHQHFAIVRMRAVEEGIPLVRVANTGISGVVDAYGRVSALLGLGEKGTIDATLPKAPDGITAYARVGDAIFGLMLMISFLAGWLTRQRR